MVKNIIFDIGGIILDDSKDNTNKILNSDATFLYKKMYGKSFLDCLLGKMDMTEYIETFKDDPEYNKIKYILSNQDISCPLLKSNFDYISSFKDRGYNLYILSNLTKYTHDYLKRIANIDEIFKGGVFSYQEGIMKPDKRIYELLINRYNLNKEETVFFDDRERNIEAAFECGIKGIVFKSIDDVENNI